MEDSVIAVYEAFKKVDNPGRYMKLKIDGKFIVMDGEPSTDSDYEAFRNTLDESEPRYCLYKMKFTTTDGRENEKICLISW